MSVQLFTHSDYSLLQSVLTVEALVDRAAKLKFHSLALTDHNSTVGHGEFERRCKEANIKPIFGLEMDVSYATGKEPRPVVVLARTNQGYRNLLELASLPHPVPWQTLSQFKEGVVLLEGGVGGEITRLVQSNQISDANELYNFYEQEFGRDFYLRHELGQAQVLFDFFDLGKFVLCQDVRYSKPNSRLSLEVLGKIKGDKAVIPPKPLLSWDELSQAFSGPKPVLDTTLRLASSCNVQLPTEQGLPPHPSGSDLDDLVRQGIKRRYKKVNPEVRERLDYELKVIGDLGYADYFVIVADIVRFAKEAGISIGPGRGSAASSLVAYVLGITEVDPLRWGLLFERFLNPQRHDKPDIDLDFCYERRGEVLSYVARRFGQDHVAQIGTYGTFGRRSAQQEVKKALGEDNPQVAMEIQSLKRHRSTHAAGVIITAKPTRQISAVYCDREIPVTHLDMYALEALGVLKIDFLGLRTLSLLRQMEQLVQKKDPDFSLATIPSTDLQTFEMLGEGKSLGVFQLESELFQDLLRQLKPNSMGDLAALLALGRPGPLNFFSDYIARRANARTIKYDHPRLKEILGETYGLILYQEQVMEIAHGLAGLSLGEADLLRRALGKGDHDAIQIGRKRFIRGTQKHSDFTEGQAEKLFSTITEFSGYAFNKAHSVSYARITWQAAYLKSNFPAEFFVTLLNQGAGRKERASYLKEAQALGVKLLPPSVLNSEVAAALEGNNLRLGLSTARQITRYTSEKIIEARAQRRFSSLAQFRRKVKLDNKDLEVLVLSGGFDDFGERNVHLRELGADLQPELELLRMEKELLGSYVSSHPCSPFLSLVGNLRGEWDVQVGEILEMKVQGKSKQGIVHTPAGILAFHGTWSAKSETLRTGTRLALFGKADEKGWKVHWSFPLGPTLLITPKPTELDMIKRILDGESGLKPTILRLGDAYHLLSYPFWVNDVDKVSARLAEQEIVYTWFDPWKENIN